VRKAKSKPKKQSKEEDSDNKPVDVPDLQVEKKSKVPEADKLKRLTRHCWNIKPFQDENG
jgi:hypothetical protein